MKSYQLKIDGMGCGHCVKKVTTALKESGFEVENVDIGTAKIKSELTAEAVQKAVSVALEDEGYMLTSVQAD